MDFSPELTALQGALISADSVHKFSQLYGKAGNEDKIEYVYDRVNNLIKKEIILKEKVTPQARIAKLRKLALYLVLNGDFALDELLEIEAIDFIIWTSPTIPLCLLSKLLWSDHLNIFVQELLSFTTPDLSLQLAEALVDYVKYLCPQNYLSQIKIICAGLYTNMCRLDFLNYNENKKQSILLSMGNIFQKAAKFFSEPPNSSDLEILHIDEQYKHKGNSLYTLMNLLYNCLETYTCTQHFPLNEDYHVYMFTYNEDHIAKDKLQYKLCDSSNNKLVAQIDKCNIILLDLCEALVMEVSVDIYCAWSEFEEGGKNLQQTIGEFCYILQQKLLLNGSTLDHPVTTMMKQISRKPLDPTDVINNIDRDIIIEKLNDGKDKSQWIHALVNRNKINEDLILLEQVINNLDILNEDECRKIYNIIYDSIKSEPGNKEELKLWLLQVFKKCCTSTQNEILTQHFSDNKFTDILASEQLNNSMTETFNKLTASPNADLHDVLCLFLQSPLQVLNKIFDVAIENAHQKDIMIDVAKLLECFKNHYYDKDVESCIVKVAINKLNGILDTDVKVNNLILFICGLKSIDIIPTNKLLLLIIMPNLHKGLVEKNVQMIYNQCRLLHDGYQTEDLTPYRAPMLAMYAQIMNVVRWRIDTYNAMMPTTLQLVTKLQMSLMNTYDDSIPENEKEWLKSKLINLLPLNMYYYRKLWKPPGTNYIEIVTGKTVNDKMDMQELTAWLSQTLICTTEQEWNDIWDSLCQLDSTKVLNLFYAALCLVTVAQGDNDSEESWACVLYCYTNFIHIVRYKYLTVPVTSEQVVAVVNKIKTTANIMKENKVEEFGAVLLPLLAYFVERKNDYCIDIYDFFQTKVKHSSFLNIVKKIFRNNV